MWLYVTRLKPNNKREYLAMTDTRITRLCGACTACDRVHKMNDMPTRPVVMPACGWLGGYGGDGDRPDKSGVFVEDLKIDNLSRYPTLFMWLSGKFNLSYAQRTQYDALREGNILCVAYRGKMTLYVPDFIVLRPGTRADILGEETTICSAEEILNPPDIAKEHEWLVGRRIGGRSYLIEGGLTYRHAVARMSHCIAAHGYRSSQMYSYPKGTLPEYIGLRDETGYAPLHD